MYGEAERLAAVRAQLRDLQSIAHVPFAEGDEQHLVLRLAETHVAVMVDPMTLKATLAAVGLRIPFLERALRLVATPAPSGIRRPLGEGVPDGAARRPAAAFPQPSAVPAGAETKPRWTGGRTSCQVWVEFAAVGSDAAVGQLLLSGDVDLVLAVLGRLR